QRRYRDARHAEPHSGAGRGIEHPGCHHNDYARCYLDVNDLTAGAPLNILASNITPIERVPAIVDLYLVPDMGRMTGRLPSGAAPGISPALIAAASGAAPMYTLIAIAKLNG